MHGLRATLELHELGERAVPSSIAPQPVDLVSPVAFLQPANHHPLHGIGNGSFQGPFVPADVGASLTLNGTVQLAGLGTFQLAGEVHGVGFVMGGRATGEMVLTGAQGTITLALHGPVQSFSGIPRELVYSVSGGTGAYSHLTGYGTVGMTFVNQLPPVGVHPGVSGTFVLAFS
jgi:hypothetical protein